MVSIGPSYNKSNDRNVCQRYNYTDYTVSNNTATNICKLNNFDKLDSVRPLDYYATWWATEIDAGVIGLNCSSTSCNYLSSSECDSFAYYTTLSCSCNSGRYKTSTGCKDCPRGAYCPGNSTSWTCRAGYEPDGRRCDLCSSWEFSDGKKYKYCTYCPSGASAVWSYCKCDRFSNETGSRAWDYETNTCFECPEDTFRNYTSNNCTQCPDGTHTYGTGRVHLEECLSCTPSQINLLGKCVSKVLFYLVLVLVGVALLLTCCCWCCCCRREKPQRPPVNIRHNQAVESPDGPTIEMSNDAPTTSQNTAPTSQHNSTQLVVVLSQVTERTVEVPAEPTVAPAAEPAPAPTAEPTAPPLPHQPAYNPEFEAQTAAPQWTPQTAPPNYQIPPWQQQQPHNAPYLPTNPLVNPGSGYNTPYPPAPSNQHLPTAAPPANQHAPPAAPGYNIPYPPAPSNQHLPPAAPPSYSEIMRQDYS